MTRAEQYKSPDGKYYQMPWKSNPVMIFYNKDMFDEGRARPGEPAAVDVRRVPRDQRARSCRSGAAQAAIWPAPSSEFFQSWFDFYPLFAAETGGKQLVEDGKATFDDDRGQGGRELLGDDVRRRAARRRRSTTATRSPTARPRCRSSARGRSRSTATRSSGAPCRCRPRRARRPRRSTRSPTRRTSRSTRACENRGTAWEVLKFATSKEQDGALLDKTGQMPLRSDLATAYPDYFAKPTRPTSSSRTRPRAPSRCPTCRTRSRSGRRSATQYSASVIFGKTAGRRRPSPTPPTEVDEPRRRVLTRTAAMTTARARAGGRARPRPAAGWRPSFGRQPLGIAVRRAVRHLPRRRLRLPARARGVDDLPRLLLRRARAPASTGRSSASTTTPTVLERPGRPPVVLQRRRLPGHQRAADGGAVARAGRRAQRGDPRPDVLPGQLLRALRHGQRRGRRRCGCSCSVQDGLVNQLLGPLAPDPSWLVNRRWRCR